MSLDQTLMEIEPILRDTDGTFQFTHPSFQEVLTAKQFADEINSGRLSVRDAYEQFWSYEEDEKLWGVNGRALLPVWRFIVFTVASQLYKSKAVDLASILSKSYFDTLDYFESDEYDTQCGPFGGKSLRAFYSPFTNDLNLCNDIIDFKQLPTKDICRKVKNEFSEGNLPFCLELERVNYTRIPIFKEERQLEADLKQKISALVNWFDFDLKLKEQLKDNEGGYLEEKLYSLFSKGLYMPWLRDKAMEGLVLLKRKDATPDLIKIFMSVKDAKSKNHVLHTLEKIGDYRAIEVINEHLIYDKRRTVKIAALYALIGINSVDCLPPIVNALYSEDGRVQTIAFEYLRKLNTSEVTNAFIKRLFYEPKDDKNYDSCWNKGYVTSGIVEFLGEVGTSSAITALEERLLTAKDDLKKKILGVLYKDREKPKNYEGIANKLVQDLGKEAAEDLLLGFLRTDSLNLPLDIDSMEAFEILSYIGGEKTIDYLIELEDKSASEDDYGPQSANEDIVRALRDIDESTIWYYIDRCVGRTSEREHEWYDEPHVRYYWLFSSCLGVLGEIGIRSTIKKLIKLHFYVLYTHNLIEDSIYLALASIHERYIPKGYNPPVKKLAA